jgi:hypothetical protein
MRKVLLALLSITMLVTLAGCGSSSPDTFSTEVPSVIAGDGDIELTAGNAINVTRSPSTVLAGVDPVSGSEFRGFLDFSLVAAGIPNNAIIDQATLDVFIVSVTPAASFNNPATLTVDLIDIEPRLALAAGDYDRTAVPAVISRTNVFLSSQDVGKAIPIDVTALMEEAQRLGLNRFKVRILQSLNPAVPDTVVEIADTNAVPPLLQVTYH